CSGHCGACTALERLVAAARAFWRRRTPRTAARRHRLRDPGGERAARLPLAGAILALEGDLRIRHLHLCMVLGTSPGPDARPGTLNRGAAVHPAIPREQAARITARLRLGCTVARLFHCGGGGLPVRGPCVDAAAVA